MALSAIIDDLWATQGDITARVIAGGKTGDEALDASRALNELEAGYFVQLADYYQRIEVPSATARYLEIAAGYEGTEAAAQASARLAVLPASADTFAQAQEAGGE